MVNMRVRVHHCCCSRMLGHLVQCENECKWLGGDTWCNFRGLRGIWSSLWIGCLSYYMYARNISEEFGVLVFMSLIVSMLYVWLGLFWYWVVQDHWSSCFLDVVVFLIRSLSFNLFFCCVVFVISSNKGLPYQKPCVWPCFLLCCISSLCECRIKRCRKILYGIFRGHAMVVNDMDNSMCVC